MKGNFVIIIISIALTVKNRVVSLHDHAEPLEENWVSRSSPERCAVKFCNPEYYYFIFIIIVVVVVIFIFIHHIIW